MSRQYHFYIPEEFGDDHPAVIAATKYIERPNAKGLFPKYEMWYGVEYFVLRLGAAERAFYQTVTVAGKMSYIYRSTTSTHDHHKETRIEPLPCALNEAPQQHKYYTNTETNSQEVSIEETNWQEGVVRLTQKQLAARKDMLSQPATILSGPPGSGKTLSVFTTLQKFAVHFETKGKSGDILIVCETPEHIKNMKREWMNWYKAAPENSGQINVIFSCYENAIKPLVSVENTANLIENPKNDCLEFISKMLRQKGRNDISKETIYAEFLIHSDKLLDDIKNKRSFEESTFNNAGKRHHNLSPEKLAIVYEIYQSYMRIDSNNNKINYILQRPELSNNNKFLLIIADEAHTYSQIQLQTMFDISEKFIPIIDTHQSESAVANLNLFQAWLNAKPGVNVNIITLPVTLRTPKVVNDVLKKILQIKRALVHGEITHSAYTSLENDENSDSNVAPGSVSCLFVDRSSTDTQWQAYGKSVNFAVIIQNESYRSFAEDFFGTEQVFTLDQARGLEFNQIVIFGFFADQKLKLISQKLPSLNLNAEATGNLGSRDELHEFAELLSTLNNLFTSFSRVKNDLILVEYSHEKDNARRLLDFLLDRKNERAFHHTETKDKTSMPQAAPKNS